MKSTWIKNALIVNEGETYKGSVVISGETIAEVIKGDNLPSTPYNETIDANECYLLPCVIDEYVHFRDPGLTH